MFVWRNFPCSDKKSSNFDSLPTWHAKKGTKQFFYMQRLPEFIKDMKIGDSKLECCEIYDLNKFKKQPVLKDCMRRAKKLLSIVNKCVLRKVIPEVVDGLCYSFGFVDSFSRLIYENERRVLAKV